MAQQANAILSGNSAARLQESLRSDEDLTSLQALISILRKPHEVTCTRCWGHGYVGSSSSSCERCLGTGSTLSTKADY